MFTNRIISAISALLLLAGVPAGCQRNEYGTVDLAIKKNTVDYDPVSAKYIYSHPCSMYSEADFARVKTSLDDGTAPDAVKQAYTKLVSNKYTSLSYEASPTSQIVRGDPTGTDFDHENYGNAMRDAAAAYQMALIWKLSGDDRYAVKAIGILEAWAATCKEITANDPNQYLAAGAQGYTFANAAEILRGYPGWSESRQTEFKNWIVTVFASKNKTFLAHNDANTCALHTWSNWDLVNLCSYLAIGVLTENDDMVNYVVNYFYRGIGNGCINNLIQAKHEDPLGTGETICQDQESGRDQGHAQMSACVTANLAQMAYTLYTINKDVKQLDFFAADENALLGLGEYVALCNLRNGTDDANANGQWIVNAADVPFNTYLYCIGCTCRNKNHGATHTQMADDSSRGQARPGWELYYCHYAKVVGLTKGFEYTKKYADKLRPECGAGYTIRYGDNSGAFDQLGWATLMLYRD